MSVATIHRQRLAYDGARTFVAAIARGEAAAVASVLGARLGPECGWQAEQTWQRLATDPDRVNAETGMWRARLDDLVAARPELRDRLLETIAQLTPLAR